MMRKASGNETDHAALLALKAGLVGGSSDSQTLSSWNDSLHFCKWVGVTCESGQQRVTVLNLVDQKTGGSISPFIGNLSFLRVINLPGNRLQGRIPKEIGLLPRLEVFNVSNNALQGGFPLHLTNCTRLLTISCFLNKLTGMIPDQLESMPNLQILSLRRNNFTGHIPSSLGNISSLTGLGLGENRLRGSIPSNLGKLKSLTTLFLQVNSLSGTIPYSLYNLTSLRILSLAVNLLSGTLAPSTGLHFPHLRHMSVGGNNLTGVIPPTISNISSLLNFDVAQNLLYGNVLEDLGRLAYLERLNLGDNNFGTETEGDLDFITSLTNITGFKGISIAGNHFGDMIPNSIGNLSDQVQSLFFGSNMLSGRIPVEIGNLVSLTGLGMEDNKLFGEVPSSIGNLIMLQELALGSNRLQGTIPSSLGNLKNLYALGLDDNQLQGSIPLTLQHCSSLQKLYLEHNTLSGMVSEKLITSLDQLSLLDMSHNSFSGSFPAAVGKLINLNYLDISNNNFSGEIPTELGNVKLCGGIPELHLPKCSSSTTDKITNEKRRTMSTLVIIAMTVSIFVGFVLLSILIWVLCREVSKKNDAPAISLLEGAQYLRISYKQLWDATDGFSVANLIGVGSFGSVYSGVLGDKPIAVKVMNLGKRGAIKSFKAECKALSTIRHRNLLRILSCCSSLDFKRSDFMALVYELMPNGSLESWLHESRILNFSQRLNIATDIASALEYLHHDCQPQIVHCDLKPSNVLLDADMVAHVGDFGLAKILRGRLFDNLSQEQSISSLGIKGTVGYVPPEYGMGANASIEGDMYSFGILLLEMVTGRRPTDEIFKDNVSLHNLCKSEVMNSNMLHILDPHLLTELNNDNENSNGTNNEAMDADKMKECMKAITEVGLACSMESPNERIDIKEALKVLHRTQTKLAEKRIRVGRQNMHHFADEDHHMNVNA
uniref:non-specific serine/threonine protein kinase n=1 Tax=Kalanchoe fedtschenkoi TaxID=63787 RepID=A0A7N0VL80_KALFE